MEPGNLVDSGKEAETRTALALLALCAGVLPVWARHLATSRAQSEVAVSQMLQAFADIGPHINMAERQSQQINDALGQPIGGVTGLVAACEQVLQPVLLDEAVGKSSKAAIEQAMALVRGAVGALEQIARPFQHETQLVAEQVDRLYVGFQYQDRTSQMLSLLEGDMARLQGALVAPGDSTPDLAAWLASLESQYAMREQHMDHAGHEQASAAGNPDENETTFF
jgi:hypothetical protein